MQNIKYIIPLLFFSTLFTGCGGGGTGDTKNTTSDTSTPSYTLENGQRIKNPDGVIIEAFQSTVDTAITLKIDPTTKPKLTLPSGIKIKGKFYRISANEDIYANDNFLLALPVSKDINTSHLALAVLSQPEDIVAEGGTVSEMWEIIPGVFSSENNYFVTTLPFFAKKGRVMALVHAEDYNSPTLQGKPDSSKSDEDKKARNSTQNSIFSVHCIEFPSSTNICTEFEKYELEQVLDQAYYDMQSLGFLKPRIKPRPEVKVSFSDGNLNILLYPSSGYLATLKPIENCFSSNGQQNLGQYSHATNMLYVCINNNGITNKTKGVARHEYFHATQYAYKKLRSTNYYTLNNWFIEGTATAAIESQGTMIRSPLKPYRTIDISLLSDSNLDEYTVQDFWVFLGNKLELGLEYLQPFLREGSDNTANINQTITNMYPELQNLSSSYWEWVKNQAFEKSIDLGNNFIQSTCKYDDRMISDIISIKYKNNAIPANTQMTLAPLSSKIVKLTLEALPSSDYMAPIQILASPSKVNYKFYDSEDSQTTDCYNKYEMERMYIDVTANKSRTFFILISNTSTDSQIAKINFSKPTSSLKILQPKNNANLIEGDTITLTALARNVQYNVEEDNNTIFWSYTNKQGTEITLGHSKNNQPFLLSTPICDGTYVIKAKTLFLNEPLEDSVRLSIRNPTDPNDKPTECKWKIRMLSPTRNRTYIENEPIDLRAIITDDHPETDNPLAPVIWRENGPYGTIIGRGLNTLTKFSAGRHKIFLTYGSIDNAYTETTVNVIPRIGSVPQVTIKSPESDNTIFWDDYDNGYFIKVFLEGFGEDIEDGNIITDASFSWSYRSIYTSSWKDLGSGKYMLLSLPLASQTVEVRLIITDSDGMEGEKIETLNIIGPPL